MQSTVSKWLGSKKPRQDKVASVHAAPSAPNDALFSSEMLRPLPKPVSTRSKSGNIIHRTFARVRTRQIGRLVTNDATHHIHQSVVVTSDRPIKSALKQPQPSAASSGPRTTSVPPRSDMPHVVRMSPRCRPSPLREAPPVGLQTWAPDSPPRHGRPGFAHDTSANADALPHCVRKTRQLSAGRLLMSRNDVYPSGAVLLLYDPPTQRSAAAAGGTHPAHAYGNDRARSHSAPLGPLNSMRVGVRKVLSRGNGDALPPAPEWAAAGDGGGPRASSPPAQISPKPRTIRDGDSYPPLRVGYSDRLGRYGVAQRADARRVEGPTGVATHRDRDAVVVSGVHGRIAKHPYVKLSHPPIESPTWSGDALSSQSVEGAAPRAPSTPTTEHRGDSGQQWRMREFRPPVATASRNTRSVLASDRAPLLLAAAAAAEGAVRSSFDDACDIQLAAVDGMRLTRGHVGHRTWARRTNNPSLGGTLPADGVVLAIGRPPHDGGGGSHDDSNRDGFMLMPHPHSDKQMIVPHPHTIGRRPPPTLQGGSRTSQGLDRSRDTVASEDPGELRNPRFESESGTGDDAAEDVYRSVRRRRERDRSSRRGFARSSPSSHRRTVASAAAAEPAIPLMEQLRALQARHGTRATLGGDTSLTGTARGSDGGVLSVPDSLRVPVAEPDLSFASIPAAPVGAPPPQSDDRTAVVEAYVVNEASGTAGNAPPQPLATQRLGWRQWGVGGAESAAVTKAGRYTANQVAAMGGSMPPPRPLAESNRNGHPSAGTLGRSSRAPAAPATDPLLSPLIGSPGPASPHRRAALRGDVDWSKRTACHLQRSPLTRDAGAVFGRLSRRRDIDDALLGAHHPPVAANSPGAHNRFVAWDDSATDDGDASPFAVADALPRRDHAPRVPAQPTWGWDSVRWHGDRGWTDDGSPRGAENGPHATRVGKLAPVAELPHRTTTAASYDAPLGLPRAGGHGRTGDEWAAGTGCDPARYPTHVGSSVAGMLSRSPWAQLS